MDPQAQARLYRWITPQTNYDSGAVMAGTGVVAGPLLEILADEKKCRLAAMQPGLGQALPGLNVGPLKPVGQTVSPHVEIAPDDFIRLCEQLGLRLPR